MTPKNNNLQSLDDFLNDEIGVKGTPERDRFEAGYNAFKLGVLIQQAREQRGLTQEQLAELSGINKSYISKLENDMTDVSFSILQRIISKGLNGQLDIAIRL